MQLRGYFQVIKIKLSFNYVFFEHFGDLFLFALGMAGVDCFYPYSGWGLIQYNSNTQSCFKSNGKDASIQRSKSFLRIVTLYGNHGRGIAKARDIPRSLPAA